MTNREKKRDETRRDGVLLVALAIGCVAVGCTPPQSSISTDGELEPIPGEENAYYSRRDNLELVGNARLRPGRMFVFEERTSFPTHPDFPLSERISYVDSFPDAVFMRVVPDGAADYSHGRWLTGDLTPPEDGGSTSLGLAMFKFPRLLLNMGERVNITGVSSRGQEASEPDGPTLGRDQEEFPGVEVELHPDVLLVPVHFRVFANENGLISSRFGPVATSWLDEEFVRSIFDPGLVTSSVTGVADSFQSSTYVTTTERPRGFAPDSPYAACGVQFRLASFRVIRQPYRIEETAFTSCSTLTNNTTPLNNPDRPPLSWLVAQERNAYMTAGQVAADASQGIDIYVTGRLRGQDDPRVECGDRPGAGYYRSTGGRNNPIWISNEWLWFGFSSAISHEIGHKLMGSTAHVADVFNVMSTAPSPSNTTEEKVFTNEQCTLVRRGAAARLFASGLISRERLDQVNAE